MQTSAPILRDSEGFELLSGQKASVSAIDTDSLPNEIKASVANANSPPTGSTNQPDSETLLALWCKFFTP